MARHRTRLTPRERVELALRWARRVALWLAFGVVVGAAALGALTWAGSLPGVRPWVAVAAGVLAAAAAGVATTVPGPDASDEHGEGPPPS